MDAEPRTLREIFGQNVTRFIIPLFQRPYVWIEKENWQPFWEDISNLAEMHLRNQGQTKRPLFIGAFVLNPLRPRTGGGLTSTLVIDGQQRITTIQVFFAALRDICKLHKLDKICQQICT
jgi:uncharacterized protein with ParB-like and HNH nuclease domain